MARGLSPEMTMKVIEISTFGAPDVLRLAERPLPTIPGLEVAGVIEQGDSQACL